MASLSRLAMTLWVMVNRGLRMVRMVKRTLNSLIFTDTPGDGCRPNDGYDWQARDFLRVGATRRHFPDPAGRLDGPALRTGNCHLSGAMPRVGAGYIAGVP